MVVNGIALFAPRLNGPSKPPVRVYRFPFSLAAAACLALAANAQSQLRCDLQVKSTPGAGAEVACLDLVAVQAGGTPIQTAGNATRISTDGFNLCKTAFQVSQPAGADIVFIYDNSGSMWPGYAKINPANNDTTFWHISGCMGAAGTPMSYNTLLGPYTIQLVDPAANCQANGLAGDPFFARGKIIEKAVDYLTANSPSSSAGALAFGNVTGNLRPPLQLSVPGNADLVKTSIALDSIRFTNYVPALNQARTWLTAPEYRLNSKQAIVFISDGEPSDGPALTTWLRNATNLNIPVYTIALGDSSLTFARMREISVATGGAFYQVAPENTALMDEVMQRIIQAITVVNLPTGVEITNSSFAPPMVSRSQRLTRNPDSSVSVVLDSIIALQKGPNALTVKVTMSPTDVRTYQVNINANGAEAGGSTTSLDCYRMPALVMLNQEGTVDSGYPSGPTPYDVRLVRTTSDLAQVIVKAVTSDPARPGWGDEENITMPQTSSNADSTVNRRENYPFNGGVANPAKGNNTLEATPNGLVTLTWSHPRDAREFASFVLAGRPIPTTPGFIDMIRAKDVPKGVTLTVPVTNPVVIRGGVTLNQTGTDITLIHKGILSNPHNLSDVVLDPDQTPTFIFKTASAFSYKVSIFDHLGQFLNYAEGAVDSLKWEQMRGAADSLAVAFSILPVSSTGQQFGSGVYIMRATLTTQPSLRQDPNRPSQVTPISRLVVNRFGYLR